MHLTINNLTKTYDAHTVLQVPSMVINSGSFWGIIGPNGSGKSTLMRILAGLNDPSTGSVLYDGQALNQQISESITLVFQKPYLLRTSVCQNIAYPLQLRGFEKKEIVSRVNRMLETLNIGYLRDQRAWTLSGGEAQKVALARALVFRPRLLMLDEPTANIDPTSILILESRIRDYYDEYQPTILMVTHNLQQTKRVCDLVAFMYEGKVLESGTLERIFENGDTRGNELMKSFIREDLM
ncbi:MAG: ATP-binding cassette domain-containing protein [Bacillota bacterium]|nr:ATP-binding cassette domain-containing protein [Bacillota bacterium]MDW7676774.1 ATP-binding cassette domain-containing protein [Bacillota bacterium]